jgi:hypothetical protein
MIYETLSADDPLQQGDIFRHIPQTELSLSEMAILSDDQQTESASWTELSNNGGGEAITAIVSIESVMGIVITQNCDNARGKDVCLCSVEPFLDVFNIQEPPKNPKKWQSLIISRAKNPRYFYLPKCEDIGIATRMTADFRTTLRVPRSDLLAMRSDFRIARLNGVATEHFRESLGNFFRRYAYNEWYPLDKEEVQSYASAQHLEASDLYDWQK